MGCSPHTEGGDLPPLICAKLQKSSCALIQSILKAAPGFVHPVFFGEKSARYQRESARLESGSREMKAKAVRESGMSVARPESVALPFQKIPNKSICA
jgi:hypothetical protein